MLVEINSVGEICSIGRAGENGYTRQNFELLKKSNNLNNISKFKSILSHMFDFL